MAKARSKKNTHTHVPSHIGFSIIAVVALVFGLITFTIYNENTQTQTVDSHAAAPKSPVVRPIAPVTSVNTSKQCISYNTSGKCVLYQTTTTVVNTKSPCISYNTSGQCTYYQGTTQTTGTFVPTVAVPNKQTSPQKQNPTAVPVNYGQSSSCRSIGGTCESTSAHPNQSGGSYHANLCPGPATWKCWVPNSSKSASSTTTSGTSYITCHNGKVVSDGGSVSANTSSTLNQFCSQYQNGVYVNGKIYGCGTLPASYKSLASKACS